jgi:hypothetical protein
MTLPFIAQAVIVFVLTLVASVCWALYFRYSEEGRPIAAANIDTLLISIGMLNVRSYVKDVDLTIPVLLGTWIGTWWAVRRRRNREAA